MTAEIWQPDEKFYKQNQRSWLLRSACLDTLAILERILKIKSRVPFMPYIYRDDLLDLYSQLEMADGIFQELGIDGKKLLLDRLEEADPVTIAEWLASELQPWTGPKIDTLNDPNILEELLQIFYVYLDASPPEGS